MQFWTQTCMIRKAMMSQILGCSQKGMVRAPTIVQTPHSEADISQTLVQLQKWNFPGHSLTHHVPQRRAQCCFPPPGVGHKAIVTPHPPLTYRIGSGRGTTGPAALYK